MKFRSKNHNNNAKANPNTEVSGSNWFLEDDEWDNLSSKAGSNKPSRSAFDKPKNDETVEVRINLRMPKLKFKLPRKIKKKYAVSAALVLIIGIGILAGNTYIKDDDYDQANVAGSNTSSPENDLLPREKPSFEILYPGTKDSNSVGEIVRISPPGNEPVFSYIDELAGTQLNISQQLIPEKFKTNTEIQIEQLAKDFQQNDVFLADGVKVFYGRSESGVQSLTFTKGNLLVFIKSAQPLEEETWAAYISALHN